VDSLLASLEEPVRLTLYVTPNTLPEGLAEAPATIETVAQDFVTKSNGNFSFNSVNVDDPNSQVSRQTLQEQFGLQPILTSLFSDQSYYLHMVLEIGDQGQLLFPSADLSAANVRTAIESALKRSSPGFLNVVGLWTPPNTAAPNAFGQPQPSLKQYSRVAGQLSQEYTVKNVSLANGQVPSDIDVLVVIAPQGMGELERFAIDQYLMRGGAVVVSAGNYALAVDQFSGSLGVEPVQGGLQDILIHYGLTIEPGLVLDPQNEPFPTQRTRTVGGIQVQQIDALDYPPFVDVRSDGMDRQSSMLAGLQAITLTPCSTPRRSPGYGPIPISNPIRRVIRA
jgi:ABC-2 type transport system permease protein